jgi:hydrogenase-1 operon protein HyaF
LDKLEAVSVTVEHRLAPSADDFACSPGSEVTGNLLPLLHEIRHALARWLDNGDTHAIDLRSIPMSPGEEQRLLELLGDGEVRASLSALGSSEIVETAFPGVWLVSHYDDDDTLVGQLIEICQIPEILKSQTEDAAMALHRLDDLLSNAETTV